MKYLIKAIRLLPVTPPAAHGALNRSRATASAGSIPIVVLMHLALNPSRQSRCLYRGLQNMRLIGIHAYRHTSSQRSARPLASIGT
jgi:hypothetical protein